MRYAVLVIVAMFLATTLNAAPFSDVPRTHWAYDAIQKAVDAGILQGYDGKFHGKRLLNRYQMAVITAKLLDKMGKGGMRTVAAAGGDVNKMIANLEALTIEFADELALLNVKVSTLEDSFTELKQKVDMGGGCAKSCGHTGGGIGLTGFVAFGLINETDEAGNHRYAQGNDTYYFELPQVSLGFDKEVSEGIFLHAQFDYDGTINGAGGVGINEAYFTMDEMFGDIGGKAGAFALPFQGYEINGPFRSSNLTITPSAINSAWERARVYGLELTKMKDVEPEDMKWNVGIVSGTDNIGAPNFQFTDAPAGINVGEGDERIGYYIMIGKKPPKLKKLGWHIAYFNANGDDDEGGTEHTAFQIGLEWWNDDFGVLVQYADGDDSTADNQWTYWYILINWKIDDVASVTLRYDSGEDDNGDGASYTLAYNRKVTDNSMFQFEYIDIDSDDITAADDPDDVVWQFRYKVHF